MFFRFVVIGIRFLDIHLHCVLAGHAAGVGYRKRYFILAVRRFFHLIVGIRERRIRFAVTKRIRHLVGIVPCTAAGFDALCGVRVAAPENVVLVARFVILISDVNALLIHEIFVVMRILIPGRKSVRTCERMIAEVLVHGRGVRILDPRIDEMSGRVDFAAEKICHLFGGDRTAHAHPCACIYVVVVYRHRLNGRRTVDEQNDAVHFSLLFEIAQIPKHALLRFRQIEITVVGAFIRIRIEVCIVILAAVAGYYHDRGVFEVIRIFKHAARQRIVEAL